MGKKEVYTIAGVIALLFILIVALFFEIREVPDYSWVTKYDLEEKDPADAYAFMKLLEQRFGEDKIELKADSSNLDSLNTGQLYVSIGSSIRYGSKDENDLIQFIKAGNDALLISQKIDLTIPMKVASDNDNDVSVFSDHDKSDQVGNDDENDFSDNDEGDFSDNEVIEYRENDGEEISDNNDDIEEDEFYEIEEETEEYDYVDTIENAELTATSDSIMSNSNLAWQFGSMRDSVLFFDFMPFDTTSTNHLVYKHYGREFNKARMNTFKYLAGKNAINRESIIYAQDSTHIYSKIKIGEGNLYVHTVPELFTNIATQQSFYLDHFNKVFSSFTVDRVILEEPDPLSYLLDREDQKSPLQYILSVPALSWAYYLLVATLILFVVFRGKRTQRIIPMMQKNTNTSMDYIKTLSILHQNQGQNSKLVKHIREGFYHRIKSMYFLDHKDEFYLEKLTAKSKIDKIEIENLLHKLNSTGGAEFSDDQLITLHKQIESFYKKAA